LSDTTTDPDDSPLEGELLLFREDYEGEDLGGRPRLYENPAQFDEAVYAYYLWCAEHHEPMTITGMALALGFCSVQTLYNYGTYDGFLESVARARLLVEYGYEKNLHGPHSAGSKFALACIGSDDRWRSVKELGGDELMTHEDRLAHLR
jgi:hypothetical protein